MGAIPNKLPGFQDIEQDAEARTRIGKHWGTEIKPHYGKNLSDESLARLWQGGPKALKRSSSRAYGRRVMRELQSMENANQNFTESHHFTAR
jgi:hypothetical protein